jgi:hypothetical protein
MEAALAEMALDGSTKDLDDDNEFVNEKGLSKQLSAASMSLIDPQMRRICSNQTLPVRMKKRNKETPMQGKASSMMRRNLLVGYAYDVLQLYLIMAHCAYRPHELVWRNRLLLHIPGKKRLSTPRQLLLRSSSRNLTPWLPSVRVFKSFPGESGKRERASVDTPC